MSYVRFETNGTATHDPQPDDATPVCRPHGEDHGPMKLRDHPSKLAAELGTWWDCQHHGCGTAFLRVSDALARHLAEQREAADARTSR